MIPSSPSPSSRPHGFHPAGVGAFRVGLHPSRQYSFPMREAAATLAGEHAAAPIALCTSTTSAAAACGHVIAMPTPTGGGACTTHLAALFPACPSLASPCRFAVSIASHVSLPSGKMAP